MPVTHMDAIESRLSIRHNILLTSEKERLAVVRLLTIAERADTEGDIVLAFLSALLRNELNATRAKLTGGADRDAHTLSKLLAISDIRQLSYDKAIEQIIKLRKLRALQHLYDLAQAKGAERGPVAKFLASLYDGSRVTFNLRALLTLDKVTREHCMTVLRLEIDHPLTLRNYFGDDGQSWEEMIRRLSSRKIATKRAGRRVVAP